MATATQLQQLYVAYFGRPADPAGLDYWVSSGISTEAFAAQMFAQPEFQSVNAGLSVEAQVNQIYLNLFGRAADSAGLLYWTKEINDGRLQLASIANDLIYAVNQGAGSAADTAALANKTSTAITFTADLAADASALLAYQPQSTNPWVSGTNFATAVSFMNTATATNAPTSVEIAASVAAIVANGAPGETITLTTERFSYLGGSGNDTFVAGLNQAGQQTLTAPDSIDGAGGTNTLIATIAASVTPASIRNIQSINATFQGNNTLDLTNATGVQSILNNGSTGNATLSGLSTSTAITSQSTGANLTLNFAGATGPTDSASLTLSGVTGGIVSIPNIETLSLTSSGSTNNALLALNGAQLTTLNVGGTAGLSITNALATVTTVAQPVGGSLSGALDLTFAQGDVTVTGGSGADTFTVNAAGASSLTGGLGNDTFAFAGGAFGGNATVSGGDGTSDTLRVTAADAATANNNISGIEILQVSTALGAALDTTAITSGITNVTLMAGTAGVSAITAPAGTLSVNLGTSNTVGLLGGNFTANDTGVATTDVLNLTNSNAGSNAFAGFDITSAGYETVNLNTGSGSTAQVAGAITVTPDGTGTGVLNISGSNGITTGAIDATTINASALTGTAALVMGAGTANATGITGSAGDDTLIASGAGTSITAGAGNDILTGAAGNDVLLAGDGNDQVTTGAGNDSVDGGAGDDRIVLAGNLTANDTISGGTGTNTVVITAAVGTAAIGAQLSNIQTLETSAAAQDMSVFGNTTITTIAESGAALAVTNASANLNTFNVLDAAPNVINSSFLRATDTTDNALTINAGGTIGAGSTFAVTDEETVTINANNFAVDLDLNAADLETLNITGSGTNNTAISLLALNAANLSSVTFTGINSTRAVTVDASSSVVALTLTGDNFAGTYSTGSGADTVTGGSLADTITTNNGADYVNSGEGNDDVSTDGGADVVNLGIGADTINAGSGADTVNVGSDQNIDRVIQAASDSVAATLTSFAGALVQQGDVMTFGAGVDIVSNFVAGAGGDQVQAVAGGAPASLLGQNATNLAATDAVFYASGSFNSTTGSFTISANGTGSDTLIVQTTGNGASNSLATNASSLVLVGVESQDLVGTNFIPFVTNNLTVAEAAQLPTGVPYNLVDTSAAIAGATDAIRNNATDITSNTAATIAQATVISGATNSGLTAIDSVNDSSAAISASNNAVLNDVAGLVTATTAATVAEATNIAGFVKPVTYNVADAIGNVGAGGAYLNEAVNISFTGTGTVAQATVAEAATNSGTTAVAAVTDSAANIAASSNPVLNTVTGAVTANTDATVAQATNISAFVKPVLYNVTDLIGNVGAGGAYLNEAVNISFTGAGTVAQATVAEAATNTGTTAVDAVSDTAANIAASSDAVMNTVTGVVIANTAATVAQATNIAGFAKPVTYNVLDSIGNVGAGGAYLNEAVNISFTGAGTVAQATVAVAATNTGTTAVAAVTDTAANIAASSNVVLNTVTGAVTANTAATVAESQNIANFVKAVAYDVTDLIGNIGAGGNYLNEAVNISFSGAGTVAQATVAEAATNTGTTAVAAVTDSAANIAATINDVLNTVTGAVTANTAATVAQATTIAGFAKPVAYNVLDSIGNVGLGGAYLNDAFNITFSGTGTVAQATIAEAATNSGTTAVAAVSDSAVNLAASNDAVLNTVTGAVNANTAATVAEATIIAGFAKPVTYNVFDAIGNIGVGGAYLNDAVVIQFSGTGTVAQATIAEAATNSGITIVQAVTDSAANIAGSSDAVLNNVQAAVTANTDATVAEASNIAAFTRAVVYNLDDYFTTVQSALGNAAGQLAIAEAQRVTARGSAAADNINMGAFTRPLSILGLGGNDSIVGGTAADTIEGGLGADVMTGGGGANQFGMFDTFGFAGTSVVASGETFTAIGGGGIAAADTVTFATGFAGAVDRITSFTSGTEKLDVVNANTAPTTLLGVDDTAFLTNGTTYVAYGQYVEATGVFTIAAGFNAGTDDDALLVTGNGALTAANTTGYQVLQGLNQALVAADFV